MDATFNYQVITTSYDPETSLSNAVIKKNGKLYEGYAKYIKNENIPEAYPSPILGQEIAESKALIKALREERRALKLQYKTCLDFFKACKCDRRYKDDSDEAIVASRQLYIIRDNIYRYNKKIKEVQSDILKSAVEADKYFLRKRKVQGVKELRKKLNDGQK